MFVQQKDAQPFEIPGGTKGLLYPSSPLGDQTVAIVDCDGVYPEKGWSINDVCTETIYVMEGELDIETGGKTYTLGPGDLFMILPKNKYRVIGKAKTCDVISPAWDKAQNHIIEE